MSIERRRLRVDASEHKIGYGRPPRHSQYKPGQSGYPRGRPKGSRNLKTVVMAALKATVKITCDGKSRKVSTLEAMCLRAREMGLGRSNLRALSLLFDLAKTYCEDELAATAAATSAEDVNVLRIYRARLLSGAAATSGASDNDQCAEPPGSNGPTMPGEAFETPKRGQLERRRLSDDKPRAEDTDQHK